MKTYGTLKLSSDREWELAADPHILMRAKRVFEGSNKFDFGSIHITNTPEHCRDLEWFCKRYPLKIENKKKLITAAQKHRDNVTRLEDIIGANYKPRKFKMALPARDYQAKSAEIYLANEFLLVGDEVGLGKSVTAIASFAEPQTLPAVVVCQAHLPKQWEGYVNKFAPDLFTHILKKGTPYELPTFMGHTPDVIITSYHKLAGWAEVLAAYANSIVFDEIQELRRVESAKYAAARHIANAMKFRLGLSATPVYNYGGEFWNIANILKPGVLGGQREFLREWCLRWGGGHAKIVEPRSFGTYLRENFILLRWTREQVGRELPEVIRVPHTIGSDTRELHRIKNSATELARIILDRTDHTRDERFVAAGQFDMIMRQATGLAKAPFVADFVRMLCESGEQVILCGWHREVYGIWEERLLDLKPAWYTGSETSKRKDEAKEKFINGEARVLFMSLRAGQGTDGFQDCCKTMVFGELDWSPGIHEQCIGRINRDGQEHHPTVYFLVSEDGADPIMADVLGLKKQQVEGIRDPDKPLIEKLQKSGGSVRKLAEHYLKGNGHGG